MSAQPSRTHVGPKFSEAARRLWSKIDCDPSRIPDLAARLGHRKPVVWRLLYGERRASRALATAIEKAFGIASGLWDAKPRSPFSVSLPKRAA